MPRGTAPAPRLTTMFTGSKATHAAQALHSARLQGPDEGATDEGTRTFQEIVRKFAKHHPNQSKTGELAQDEHTLHRRAAQFYNRKGYRDSAHADDTPFMIVFPPAMDEGSEAVDVHRLVQRLGEDASTLSPADAHASTALRAYGLFLLGLDQDAIALLTSSPLLQGNPLASRPAPYSAEDQHAASLVILASTVYGLAHERSARLETAIRAYERACAVHQNLRGGRAAPSTDLAERWAAVALYRLALLTVRVRGGEAGRASVRAFQAQEDRWPATFAQPQRKVVRELDTRAVAAPSQTPRSAHTTSTRRPHPTLSGSPAASHEFIATRRAVARLLEQTTALPRADESNAPTETLAEQLVRAWRQDGAPSGAPADEVVALLYGMAKITFRSQTILRLLVQMLVAAEAYEEAVQLTDKYLLLVESSWQAAGIANHEHEMRDGCSIESVAEYLDTLLLTAHVELVYLADAPASYRLASRLLHLVGYTPHDQSPSDPSAMHPGLPKVEVARPAFARILRAAGQAELALVRTSPASQRTDREEHALARLKEAVSLDDQATESVYALAYAQAPHDVPAALVSARRMLELEPASIDAWHLIVLLLTAQKDYRSAREFAEEALAHADDDDADGLIPTQLLSYDYPPSLRERGQAYVRLLATHNQLLELTEGVQVALDAQQDLFSAFQTKVASVPTAAVQPRNHASVHAPTFTGGVPRRLTATPAEARLVYRAYVEHRILQSVWLISAASFRRAGDRAQARAAIEEAEALDPLAPDVWVQLALWCVEEGKPGTAVTSLYKALGCDTDHVPATLHLARLLMGGEVAHTATATAAEAEARKTPVPPRETALSTAESLLRTATLGRAYDTPEAWHLLAQLDRLLDRPRAVERAHLHTALRLEGTRPLRPLHIALASP